MRKVSFGSIGLIIGLVTGTFSAMAYVHDTFASKDMMQIVLKKLDSIETDVKLLLRKRR